MDLEHRYSNDGNKRYIIYFKEFYNKFNLCATNTTNNSILLHTQIILPLDSTTNYSDFTHPVVLRYKNKESVLKE